MEEIARAQADAGLTPELFEAFARIYAELSERAVADAPEDVADDIPLETVLSRLRGDAAVSRRSAGAGGTSPIRLSCVSRTVAVAQLVEPRVVVPVVAGSSPVRHLVPRPRKLFSSREI